MILAIGLFRNEFGRVLLSSCMNAFAVGGLYAYASEHATIKKIFLRTLNRVVPVAILVYLYWIFFPRHYLYSYTFRTVDSIISIWMIHKIIHNKSARIEKIFIENKVLTTIGKISYGIYLYHFAVHFCYTYIRVKLFGGYPGINEVLSNFYFVYFMELALLFIVSYCSFYLLEQPIMKLKRKFR
ncbi:MAG: hypothetical protein JST75_11330 [Bacteroidetes bacterium]|nr:hypothetical protein [Bacteroidota bacterium]